VAALYSFGVRKNSMDWERIRLERERKIISEKIKQILSERGIEASEATVENLLSKARLVEFEHGGFMISIKVGDTWMDIKRGIWELLNANKP
jgi:hypothetical protein